MERVQDFLTQRIGPLPAYAWLGLVAGFAFLYISMGRRTAGEDKSEDPAGEFAGSVSSETVDESGNILSSEYSFSGNSVTTPGNIGIPIGYSNAGRQGDIFINYPEVDIPDQSDPVEPQPRPNSGLWNPDVPENIRKQIVPEDLIRGFSRAGNNWGNQINLHDIRGALRRANLPRRGSGKIQVADAYRLVAYGQGVNPKKK